MTDAAQLVNAVDGAASRSTPARTGASTRRQDLMVIALLYVLDMFVFWEWWRVPGLRSRELASPLIALMAYGAVLVWSRRWPVWTFALVWSTAAVTSAMLHYHPYLSVLTALYLVTLRRPVRVSALALVSTMALLAALQLYTLEAFTEVPRPAAIVMPVLLWWLIVFLVWAVALKIREDRRRVEDLDARREAEAAAAVADERLRIARDLHDIVAHSVSVMVLQAAGARRMLSVDRDRAEQALLVIEQTGLQSMQELRRLLGVLRASGGEDAVPDVERQPGLDDLDDLVDLAQRTGLAATLDQTGNRCRLDPSVELAAYRVVQESLTNTRKHAGPHARAAVRLTWGGDLLTVDVDDERLEPLAATTVSGKGKDPGTASALGGLRPSSAGHGLLGLRERVTAIGGSFAAGPTPAGFRVTATLPCSSVSDHPGESAPAVGGGPR